MTTGIGGYGEKVPGNVPGLNNEVYKQQVVDKLDRFIREIDFFGQKNWPPGEFIGNPKMKAKLIDKLDKLAKNFPFDQFELEDLLRSIEKQRAKSYNIRV